MDHKEFEDRLQRLTLFKQKQFKDFFLDFIGENVVAGNEHEISDAIEINIYKDKLRAIVTGK